MSKQIQFYQWPNIIALDAAVVAVAWQATFATSMSSILDWPAYTVLGLSVWLTYLADRLYDVRSRALPVLKSLRHRFAKKHRRTLWKLWWCMLLLNLGIATQLTTPQLQKGFILLALCLAYTFLNQRLSRRFFPKECCVALIFAGGVIVFIPAPITLGPVLSFAWLCLLNCLIIGAREKEIDANMQVHSIASIITERYLATLAFASALVILLTTTPLAPPIAACTALLGILHLLRNRIKVEDYRVLADTVILLGAALGLVF